MGGLSLECSLGFATKFLFAPRITRGEMKNGDPFGVCEPRDPASLSGREMTFSLGQMLVFLKEDRLDVQVVGIPDEPHNALLIFAVVADIGHIRDLLPRNDGNEVREVREGNRGFDRAAIVTEPPGRNKRVRPHSLQHLGLELGKPWPHLKAALLQSVLEHIDVPWLLEREGKTGNIVLQYGGPYADIILFDDNIVLGPSRRKLFFLKALDSLKSGCMQESVRMILGNGYGKCHRVAADEIPAVAVELAFDPLDESGWADYMENPITANEKPEQPVEANEVVYVGVRYQSMTYP